MRHNIAFSTFVVGIVVVLGCSAWAWTKAPAALPMREPSTRTIAADTPVNPDRPFTYVDGRDSNPPELTPDATTARFAGKENAETMAAAKARLAKEAAAPVKPYPTPNTKRTVLAHYRPMPSEPEKVDIIWFND